MAPTDDPGPIPEDNRPGHHPAVDQDKPPGEAFAQRLGLVPDPDASDGSDASDGATAAPEAPAPTRTTAEAAMAVSDTAGVDRRGPVTAALLDGAGPPAGPVTPVEVVAETLELGVRFAIAAALLPARLTAATVRMALQVTGHQN
jgi:hypothetical protein